MLLLTDLVINGDPFNVHVFSINWKGPSNNTPSREGIRWTQNLSQVAPWGIKLEASITYQVLGISVQFPLSNHLTIPLLNCF